MFAAFFGFVANAQEPRLMASNLAAPFCYEHGGTRRWPILAAPLAEDVSCSLTASHEGKELARSARLEFSGLTVSVSREGWLEIQSPATAAPLAFDLEIKLQGGVAETQRLSVRAAPPARPISYIADFGDDLIDLFMDRTTGRWRPMDKGSFDQYFRRMQAHGVRRLIVWQSPFPFMADAKNYPVEDWLRYTTQAQAIIESRELSAILEKRGGIVSWGWLRALMAVRLTPQFSELLTRSALEHGIALTASFRPFEMALEKYYAVPAFDESGAFLWNFHPLASPAVDYHADEVGFAHYRTVLASMGHADASRLQTIEIRGATNAAAFVERFTMKHDNLRMVAMPFPPLQEDSFVLVRGKDAHFALRPFREIKTKAEARCRELQNVIVDHYAHSTVRISAIKMPNDCRYLVLSNPSAAEESLDAPGELPVTLWAEAGNQLGRVNVHWVAPPGDAAGKKTRVAGIGADGDAWADFFAVEASAAAAHSGPPRRRLQNEVLVIDLGDPWSVEMVDFNQPAARRYVVNELRSILSHPPFDEIFINTRSHTSLAATQADGDDGVKPLDHYRAVKQPYVHLGIDRAYAPRGAASNPRLLDLADMEHITNWQPGEWVDSCQSEHSPFVWRYARNRSVADGVRKLLEDLEKAFPKTRIRTVIPERASAVANVLGALEKMPNATGGVYGRDYYRRIWAELNHIPAIGEGMTLLDLHGLRVEPVFGGIRLLPDRGPFDLFVREVIADMSDNHGSSFRGARSFFYEGHETLRATDAAAARKGREERICHLLDQRGEINEVILYEAASWLGMPLNDSDLCGHYFLDRCGHAR
ncbi:MAG: hypothetical protein EXS41_00725 [Opitutaceae bacterium]|nr:hypothetical protein [Opitutaceae bacterium]